VKRILIVDDDARLRHLYREILEDEGYAIVEAANGVEALERVKAEVVDIIMLDLMMPVMDGLEFLSHWTADDPPRRTRVLVCSASPKHMQQAERYGIDAALTKPFELNSLLETVNGLTLDNLAGGHACVVPARSRVA
jgi:CheY-like chemotaxis protein